jgi:hypothetical protein
MGETERVTIPYCVLYLPPRDLLQNFLPGCASAANGVGRSNRHEKMGEYGTFGRMEGMNVE